MPRSQDFGAKSAFIRANPTVKPAELVKLAEGQGIKITTQHTANVRHYDKAKAAKTTAAPKAKTGRKPGRPANAANGAPAPKRGDLSTSDAALLRAIADVGLVRAREIFARVEKAFEGIE
jgi:hypothetical protein